MNAIPPSPPAQELPEARTVRHLAMLRELAEIGMALARAVGEQALQELAPQAGPLEAPQAARPATTPSRAEPATTFARLARAVRQTIALEARIAAGGIPGARTPHALRPAPDARRQVIRRVLRQVAAADGIPLDREIDERLGDELDADPDGAAPVEDVIAAICHDLGLPRGIARQPDEVLAMLGLADPSELAVTDPRDESPHPAGPDPP
jgi:hypothetical protein